MEEEGEDSVVVVVPVPAADGVEVEGRKMVERKRI